MPWDVFVSHNRQEKPWVREFVSQLRQLGLRVFFDEDSVSIGGEFHREVTEAIADSRTVVFVISAASTMSPWVADEIDTALHYKAQGRGRTSVLPVFMQNVVLDHPGVAKLAAVRLDRGGQRDAAYERLLRAVLAAADIPASEPLPRAPAWPGSRELSDSLKISNGGRALAIGAHWDDVLLGCLGTLLRLQLAHDYQVTIAVLCTTYSDRYYGYPQQ